MYCSNLEEALEGERAYRARVQVNMSEVESDDDREDLMERVKVLESELLRLKRDFRCLYRINIEVRGLKKEVDELRKVLVSFLKDYREHIEHH